MNNILNKIKGSKVASFMLLSAVAACFTISSLSSCTENIDESDLYTFTGEMMVNHFEAQPDTFGSYLEILKLVKPSKKANASSMYSLLKARGNYTCFAPTNEAIATFMDSVYKIGQIDASTFELTKQNDFSTVPDSVLNPIVYNSIIENGDAKAYASTDFVDGALAKTNMSDRYISTTYGTKVASVSEEGDTALATVIYVNTHSAIIEPDIEVENGYIHLIDRVITPSNATVADVIMVTENTKFFGSLLEKTAIYKKMGQYLDEEWEINNEDKAGKAVQPKKFPCRYPEHRKIGFTVFVETDSVFTANGITDLESLKEWVKANANYDDDTNCGHTTSWGDDYEDDYNWLNQFVSYHILPEAMTYDRLTIMANEYGKDASSFANNSNTDFKVNTWEYWETIGVQRRSVKVTGLRAGKRLNRYSVYNLTTYKEKSSAMTEKDLGIGVLSTNPGYDNNTLNGFYYPIDGILIWNKDVPNRILNERMRYDVTALFPEFITNKIRMNFDYNTQGDGGIICEGDYLDNLVDITKQTYFQYLPNRGHGHGVNSWMNYQTDEFNIQGVFDFTMKLPPVPYTGTYELRYGINANDNRGMAQIYIGKNPNNLPAVGIPIDLRASSGTSTSATGWVKDDTKDAEANAEVDKSMRNLGFMKGPKYITLNANSEQGRDAQNCLRKIIYTGQFEAGQTYYIRFKSVLNGDGFEFFYDYLELVPKSVYAGDEAEDIW